MNIGALFAIAMPQPSTGAKTLGSGFASPIVPAGIDDVVAPCGNLLLSTLGASPGQPAALHFSSGLKLGEEPLSFSDELIAAILSNLRVQGPNDSPSIVPAANEAMVSPSGVATITTSQPTTGSSWPGLETPLPTFRFDANAEAFLAGVPPAPSDAMARPIQVPTPLAPAPQPAAPFSVTEPIALPRLDHHKAPKGPHPRLAEPPPPWVSTDLPEPTAPPRTEAAATPSEEFVIHEPTAQSLRMDLAAPKPTVSRPSGLVGPQVSPETPVALTDDAHALASLIRASADQIKAVRVDVALPAAKPVPTPDTRLPSEPSVHNLLVRESLQPTMPTSAEGRPTLPTPTPRPTIPDLAPPEQAEPIQQAIPQADDRQDHGIKSVRPIAKDDNPADVAQFTLDHSPAGRPATLDRAEDDNPADVAQFTLDSSTPGRPANLDRAVDRLALGLGKSDTPNVSDPLVTTAPKAPTTTPPGPSAGAQTSPTPDAKVNMESDEGSDPGSIPKSALPLGEPAPKVKEAKSPITTRPEQPAGEAGTHPTQQVAAAPDDGPRSNVAFAKTPGRPERVAATPEVANRGTTQDSAERPERVAATPEVANRGTTRYSSEHPERGTTPEVAERGTAHGGTGEGDAQPNAQFELKTTAEEPATRDLPEKISKSATSDVAEVPPVVESPKQVDAPQHSGRTKPIIGATADAVPRPFMKAHQAHFRDRIEMLAAAKASEAVTLLIDPKGLGEIRVTLTQREGAVEAHAASPDERVREVLASSHQDLQRQFDQRGLKLERFTVDSSLADSSSRGYNPDSARGHQGHTPPRPQFTGVQIETSQPVHRRVPTGALDLAI